MNEQERFERWKASQMAEGWTYEKLKSVGDAQEQHFGWRYAEGSIMAKDWKVWSAAAQAVPEGYVVVPIEPTGAMVKAGSWNDYAHSLPDNHVIEIYKAMIQAAQENN